MTDSHKPKASALLISISLTVVMIAGGVLLNGCAGKKDGGNILLITLDTQRADYIGAYTQGNAATPHLDAIAEGGHMFENAYCLIPISPCQLVPRK